MLKPPHKGMPCPLCAGETHVSDSRAHGSAISRRRRCKVCAHRFSTTEVPTGLLGRQRGVPVSIAEVETLLTYVAMTHENIEQPIASLLARLRAI